MWKAKNAKCCVQVEQLSNGMWRLSVQTFDVGSFSVIYCRKIQRVLEGMFRRSHPQLLPLTHSLATKDAMKKEFSAISDDDKLGKYIPLTLSIRADPKDTLAIVFFELNTFVMDIHLVISSPLSPTSFLSWFIYQFPTQVSSRARNLIATDRSLFISSHTLLDLFDTSSRDSNEFSKVTATLQCLSKWTVSACSRHASIAEITCGRDRSHSQNISSGFTVVWCERAATDRESALALSGHKSQWKSGEQHLQEVAHDWNLNYGLRSS